MLRSTGLPMVSALLALFAILLAPPTLHSVFQVRAAASPQDFSISATSTSLSVTLGSSATTTITLSSMNGFSGTVALSGTVTPPYTGPSVSFTPSSVTLSSGGQASSILTVSAPGGRYNTGATGNFSVNVTATNGSLSHSTTVQVAVGTSDLTLILIAVGIVAIVAAFTVVPYLMRRRKASE